MADGLRRGRYSYYDPEEDLIWTDITGVHVASVEVIDEIFDELIAIAKSRPGRFVLACWKDVSLDSAEVVMQYTRRTADLARVARGILRYEVTDPLTRSAIRTAAIKHRAEGTKSNMYGSREEALAAVASLRGSQPPRRTMSSASMPSVTSPAAGAPRRLSDSIPPPPGTDRTPKS